MNCEKNNRDFSFSRSLVEYALAVYIENGLSVKNPVQCLDLTIEKQEGSKWEKTHGSSIKMMESSTSNGCDNNSDKIPSCKSNYTIIEKTDFNFVYVECTTEGSSYFDCVFRKIARNGLFAITTSDDPALYGRPAEPALRCYAGRITRTFYAPELAVRLILASMARSAARFSKSIEVLIAVAIKNSVTILLKVKKGADAAVQCLKEVKTLVHCTICEERSFLPDNDGFVLNDVVKYLSCECASQSVGRTMLTLGPLWAGPLGSISYITSMLSHASHSTILLSFLQAFIIELRCEKKLKSEEPTKMNHLDEKNDTFISNDDSRKEEMLSSKDNVLKRKADSDTSGVKVKLRRQEKVEGCGDRAPAFYYNLHKHKPKGCEKLLKADKVIDILHRQGFRACRTVFDRAAVKTDATLHQLQSVLSQIT